MQINASVETRLMRLIEIHELASSLLAAYARAILSRRVAAIIKEGDRRKCVSARERDAPWWQFADFTRSRNYMRRCSTAFLLLLVPPRALPHKRFNPQVFCKINVDTDRIVFLYRLLLLHRSLPDHRPLLLRLYLIRIPIYFFDNFIFNFKNSN